MKNFIKLIGAITMIAVIGFSMAACSDDDGGDAVENTDGRLTITGIPAEYNGKYIYGSSVGNSRLFACANIHIIVPPQLHLAQISAGTATLKVWRLDETGRYRNYNGNDSVQFMLGMFDLPDVAENLKKPGGGVIATPSAAGGVVTVNFSSGIGSAAVSSWDPAK